MSIKNKQEEDAIKKLLKEGRRESAMSILKLKKIRESQVGKCQATYFKLEEMVRLIYHAFRRYLLDRIPFVESKLTFCVGSLLSGHVDRKRPSQRPCDGEPQEW